ncbi:helix-turn-helix domain-containing protein [Candidatus Micrarchaeota archaeon]|nr:helix-turn-helix domain-containing protein [Candidatus Micrarchaeota archaeon]
MLEIKNRRGLVELLKKNSGETKAFFKIKPTVPLVTLVLSHTQAEEIYCSQKTLSTLNARMLEALEKTGVEVKAVETRMGRPRTHAEETIKQAKELRAQGKKPEEIAKQLAIPLRTVYYYVNGK